MPVRAPRPCPHPGCGRLTPGGRCAQHQAVANARERERRAASDAQRPSSSVRGYGSQWRKARDGYLRKHPLCVDCAAEGRMAPAQHVDHKQRWQSGATEDERKRLFWDSSNWAGLCASHHSVKTARDDGGFGNRRAEAGSVPDTHPGRGGGSIIGGMPGNRVCYLPARAANIPGPPIAPRRGG